MVHQPPQALLFPPISPDKTGYLDVGHGHQIYFEQCGARSGVPVVFLHGGPGSGCHAQHRQLFDPQRFRVLLFDQRGCGRSKAKDALTHNTSQDLVQDIEALRQHLGIERGLVVGGSGGAGLGLAYAHAHPAQCLGLLLRGVFLGRGQDLHWFFQDMRQLLPDAWAELAKPVPPARQGHLFEYLHEGLNSHDPAKALACALAWQAWERAVTARQFVAVEDPPPLSQKAAELQAKYKLQSHYLSHACFWSDMPLLERAQSLPRSLPVALVHGRLDWVCRPQSAWELHAHLAHSQLIWLDACGHNQFEPEMVRAAVQLLDRFATHGHFQPA